jgi:hypothetical protein
LLGSRTGCTSTPTQWLQPRLSPQSNPMLALRLSRPLRSALPLCQRSFSLMPFKLADIGEGIAEVELMKWFVKVYNYFLQRKYILSIYFKLYIFVGRRESEIIRSYL